MFEASSLRLRRAPSWLPLGQATVRLKGCDDVGCADSWSAPETGSALARPSELAMRLVRCY
jgi:hypothetical protein